MSAFLLSNSAAFVCLLKLRNVSSNDDEQRFRKRIDRKQFMFCVYLDHHDDILTGMTGMNS